MFLKLPAVACIKSLSQETKRAETLLPDTSDQAHEPHLKVGGQLRQDKV